MKDRVVCVMGVFSWLTGTDKFGAAQSALVAKFTFAQLTEGEKKNVEETACRIMEVGGFPRDRAERKMAEMKEDERYCLYAIAMAEVGIKPAMKDILYQNKWYPIKNPFVALINAEKHLRVAQHQIKKKYNIEIGLCCD